MGRVADAPAEASIRTIFARVRERRDPSEHAFFAELFAAVKAEYPFFTSRDVRNIQRAVDGRIMDFDFPPEWLANPEVFFRQAYERRSPCSRELMRANMGGLSFGDVRLQEAIRYLDTTWCLSPTPVAAGGSKEAAEQLSIRPRRARGSRRRDAERRTGGRRGAGPRRDGAADPRRSLRRGARRHRHARAGGPLQRLPPSSSASCRRGPGELSRIDGLGWSPEIARDKGDIRYLCAGIANPMGVIVSPSQRGKPIYSPFNSYDRRMLDAYFDRYHQTIARTSPRPRTSASTSIRS